ncbi:MAG: serine hydrolase [Myxococcales bacterium FL481]|nr:MAG: serine hydrolase [Myxococcales bacterium FL481]
MWPAATAAPRCPARPLSHPSPTLGCSRRSSRAMAIPTSSRWSERTRHSIRGTRAGESWPSHSRWLRRPRTARRRNRRPLRPSQRAESSAFASSSAFRKAAGRTRSANRRPPRRDPMAATVAWTGRPSDTRRVFARFVPLRLRSRFQPRLRTGGSALGLALAVSACAGRDRPAATPPTWSTVTQPAIARGQWEVVDDVTALGWSEAGLKTVQAEARKLESAVLLIVTRGQVVLRHGDIEHKYQVHSVRKSLLSALYGMAIERGQIDLDDSLRRLGIDDRDQLTRREKRATVDDLLCARSGVYLKAAAETKSMRKKRPDRGAHRAGDHWYYNNWDFNAAGTIYEQATGRSVFVAFEHEIARPLGMQDFDHDGTWYSGHRSTEHRAYKFRLSSRDLARFGQLFLQQGQWGEREVIPRSWVHKSTELVSETDRSGSHSGYGRMWWVMVKPGSEALELGRGAFTASGNGGQRVTVIPAMETVIVHRVDTDDKSSRRVKTREYDRLLAKVFRAWRGRRSIPVAEQLERLEVQSQEMTPAEMTDFVRQLARADATPSGSPVGVRVPAAG